MGSLIKQYKIVSNSVDRKVSFALDLALLQIDSLSCEQAYELGRELDREQACELGRELDREQARELSRWCWLARLSPIRDCSLHCFEDAGLKG
jgi:hypothetical protein